MALAPGARIDPARRFAAGVGGVSHMASRTLRPRERRDRIEQVPARAAATRRFDHVQAEEREDQVALRPQDLGPVREPDGLAVLAGLEDARVLGSSRNRSAAGAGRPVAASTAAISPRSRSRPRILNASAMAAPHGALVGKHRPHHLCTRAGASGRRRPRSCRRCSPRHAGAWVDHGDRRASRCRPCALCIVTDIEARPAPRAAWGPCRRPRCRASTAIDATSTSDREENWKTGRVGHVNWPP